jgi:hypothetical protein
MRCTSDNLFQSTVRADSAAVFDAGLVIDPFGDHIVAACADRGPVLCIRCAAYLSPSAHLDPSDGSWICSLCGSSNPSFLDGSYGIRPGIRPDADLNADLRRLCTELNSKHYTFTEEVSAHSILGLGAASFGRNDAVNQQHTDKLVFSVDRELCGNDDAVALLCEGLATLPDICEILLIIYDRHLRLLRLGGGALSGSDPVKADILPGNSDLSSLLAHQMHRNSYFIPVKQLRQHMDALKSGLAAFHSPPALGGYVLANRVDCTLDALVGIALTAADPPRFGATSGGSDIQSRTAARLVLLTSQSIYCAGSFQAAQRPNSPGDVGNGNAAAVNRLALYSNLGSRALNRGCSIDVFHASMRATNLDCLDALTSPSGGSVVSGSSYTEANLRESFLSLLSRSSGYGNISGDVSEELYRGYMPTLEVRTCGKVVVDRIVGPIASAEEAASHNLRPTASGGSSGSSAPLAGDVANNASLQAAKLALDDAHLSQSLYHLRDYANPSTKLEDFQAQLWRRNQDSVVVSGINMRCRGVGQSGDAQDAVTIQVKLAENGQSGSSLLTRKSVALGNTDATANVNRSDSAYVQVVARFYLRVTGTAFVYRCVCALCRRMLAVEYFGWCCTTESY